MCRDHRRRGRKSLCLPGGRVKLEMDYLKKKVDAGADAIITQMFFDANTYGAFFKACRKHGINAGHPGIMLVQAAEGFEDDGHVQDARSCPSEGECGCQGGQRRPLKAPRRGRGWRSLTNYCCWCSRAALLYLEPGQDDAGYCQKRADDRASSERPETGSRPARRSRPAPSLVALLRRK